MTQKLTRLLMTMGCSPVLANLGVEFLLLLFFYRFNVCTIGYIKISDKFIHVLKYGKGRTEKSGKDLEKKICSSQVLNGIVDVSEFSIGN